MQTTMMTTAMMFEKKNDSVLMTNGNGRHVEVAREEGPVRFWTRIRINEWTFSLSLLALSLCIVLGKLYANYVTTFTQMYETIRLDTKTMDSKRFVNASNEYAEVIASTVITFYGKYWWLLKAIISGLVITSFTWFILYKDSSIPGVNPPTPFSPSRQRIHEGSRIQLNYLVGALNGILFFIYMCL